MFLSNFLTSSKNESYLWLLAISECPYGTQWMEASLLNSFISDKSQTWVNYITPTHALRIIIVLLPQDTGLISSSIYR